MDTKTSRHLYPDSIIVILVSRPDFCQSRHDPSSTCNTSGIYFGRDNCDHLWPSKTTTVQPCDRMTTTKSYQPMIGFGFRQKYRPNFDHDFSLSGVFFKKHIAKSNALYENFEADKLVRRKSRLHEGAVRHKLLFYIGSELGQSGNIHYDTQSSGLVLNEVLSNMAN